MRPAQLEIAQIINQFGKQYLEQCKPNSFIIRTLDALNKCRTSALGGHVDSCDACGKKRISYNSCGNRHCPKCQSNKQAIWADDRMNDALDVKYFHIVFTVPDALNEICLLNNKQFYNDMFNCVWGTLQTFGYSTYGIESGAICVLHTWGQNLSLHPHIHCIVPAVGLTWAGYLKEISKEGKYLYTVEMLSCVFRGKLLEKIKHNLKVDGLLKQYHPILNDLWVKPWVVHCKPSLGNAIEVVKYLAQYTHHVAITNHRIQNIEPSGVSFSFKDYRDDANIKRMKLSGIEFLRRFALHILPYRFVKIRYFGILSSKYKDIVKELLIKKPNTIVVISRQERIKLLTGFDIYCCPFCKKGIMHTIEILPKIRAPSNILYPNNKIFN